LPLVRRRHQSKVSALRKAVHWPPSRTSVTRACSSWGSSPCCCSLAPALLAAAEGSHNGTRCRWEKRGKRETVGPMT
jgi:hypothetical protein